LTRLSLEKLTKQKLKNSLIYSRFGEVYVETGYKYI
jgi:hypothetical protein